MVFLLGVQLKPQVVVVREPLVKETLKPFLDKTFPGIDILGPCPLTLFMGRTRGCRRLSSLVVLSAYLSFAGPLSKVFGVGSPVTPKAFRSSLGA